MKASTGCNNWQCTLPLTQDKRHKNKIKYTKLCTVVAKFFFCICCLVHYHKEIGFQSVFYCLAVALCPGHSLALLFLATYSN